MIFLNIIQTISIIFLILWNFGLGAHINELEEDRNLLLGATQKLITDIQAKDKALKKLLHYQKRMDKTIDFLSDFLNVQPQQKDKKEEENNQDMRAEQDE